MQGIRHSARRQAQLIEDLLDVARITSGKLRLDRTFVDLRETVRDAVEVAAAERAKPRASISLIRRGRGWARSTGTAHGCSRLWSNLLSNAIKFTPEAAGSGHAAPGGHRVELMVADTGKGIAPDFLPSVFEAFRQGDGSTTRVHAGLGLGLSIVKTLVEAHGGTVAARSAGEHRGATFTVSLPMAVSAEHGRPERWFRCFQRQRCRRRASLEGSRCSSWTTMSRAVMWSRRICTSPARWC